MYRSQHRHFHCYIMDRLIVNVLVITDPHIALFIIKQVFLLDCIPGFMTPLAV